MKKEYEERLMSFNWFSNLGKQDINEIKDFTIRFEYLKNTSEMEKKIDSLKWENKIQEEQAKVTLYLHNNQREKYQMWNEYVEESKRFIDKHLKGKLISLQKEKGFSDEFISSVKWDILHFLVVSKFNEHIEGVPDFFLELIKIYEKGHVPCGWHGRINKGFLFVY